MTLRETIEARLVTMDIPEAYRSPISFVLSNVNITDDIHSDMAVQMKLVPTVGYLSMCVNDDISREEKKLETIKAQLYKDITDVNRAVGVGVTKDYINAAIAEQYKVYSMSSGLGRLYALKEFVYHLSRTLEHRANILVQVSANTRKYSIE